jgi:hypothetical protein
VSRFSLVIIAILGAGLAACNKGQNQAAQNQSPDVTNSNPADGNLASATDSAAPPQTTPAVASSGQSYAPPPSDSYNAGDYADNSQDQQPIEASQAPPPLPDYQQPPAPGDDYAWTPGYWAYASDGYYWVPGAWVLAPFVDALWTPPWWGYDNGVYLWHTGYWGPHIGYYGGIDYGFGYTGSGYYGAYWNHGQLEYNRSVTNVDAARIHNVYTYEVPNRDHSRVSYNGGRGGIEARPTPQELAVVHDPRTAPVRAQVDHAHEASSNRAQFASAGQAKPAALVAARPLKTTYKVPSARPPAAAIRAAQRPAPQEPARVQPSQRGPAEATRVPENRPVPQPVQRPEARPAPQARPAAPGNRVTAERPAPVQRPEARPAPQARVEARPAAPSRPEPQARPEARPAPRPEVRPVARPEARPTPQARPEARPAPRPEVRPVARPEVRPTPQARPEARPAPRPEARPTPQARPEARPAARPAPQKAEPKKDEHKGR